MKYYLRNWLPVDKESRIIDLACGEGHILHMLHRMGYVNVEGVDISDSQLRIARQISDRAVKADVLEYLKITNSKYDLILSFDLIEHLQKDEVLEFIDLCKVRLNVNGRLVLQTPNATSPFFGDVRYGDITHELGFTPNILSQLLRRSGFTFIESRETGPVPYGYSVLSTMRYAAWQMLRLVMYLYSMIETGDCKDKIFTRVFIQSGVNQG